MAIVFPNSPSTGDSFTATGVGPDAGQVVTTGTNNSDALNLVSSAGSGHTPVLTLTNTNAGAYGGALLFQSTSSGSTYNAAQVSSDGASGSGTGNLFFHTSGSEKMRLTATGDVGIGCVPHSNAGINLHIHGDNAAAELRLTNTTTGTGANGGVLQQSSTTLYLNNTESGNLVFENNGSERMRINSSGNVGIGTTAPSEKLVVSGTGIFGGNADNGANAGIRLWYGGAIAAARSSGSIFSGYTVGNSTPRISIAYTGMEK